MNPGISRVSGFDYYDIWSSVQEARRQENEKESDLKEPANKKQRLDEAGNSQQFSPVPPLVEELVVQQEYEPASPSSTNTQNSKRKREDSDATKSIPAAHQTSLKTAPAPFAAKVDEVCNSIAHSIFTDPTLSVAKAFETIAPHQPQVIAIMNELMHEFEKRYPQPYFLEYGDHVPRYFANVANKSPQERKYLSLAGIRNLILIGPRIIDDFRDLKFLGGEHHYGFNKGAQALRYYTGTVVDLDTQIEANDDQEAIAIAKPLIVNFGKTWGLQGKNGQELIAEEVASQMPYRKLNLPQHGFPIHYSQSHEDRSNYGIWTRGDHQLSKLIYFVNVPNLDFVLGATLRFPYIVAELAWKAKAAHNGILPEAFLDEFFDKGLSDKCFNEKLRAFTEFYHNWITKFDEVASPEQTAREKLSSGAFGEYLQKQNPNSVLEQKYSRTSLIQLFEKHSFTVDDLTSDEFVLIETDRCIQILQEADLWEKVLYQTEPGQDYFLLNAETLRLFLKNCLYLYIK